MFCLSAEANSMRYPKIKQTEPLRFTPELPNGIKPVECFDDGDGTKLCDGLNIWRRDGRISTRPAICCRPDSIKAFEMYEHVLKGLTPTDNLARIGGELYKIAYATVTDNDSADDVCVYLLSFTGKIIPIGKISVRRVSADTFYRIRTVAFFQGAAGSGCGIYAFLRRAHGENTACEVYELDTALENWNMASTFYTPTVQSNGRGTRYSEARREGMGYADNPDTPESVNMLSGRFRAYFTSDGFSASFKLPACPLTLGVITCRMYTAPNQFVEWKIYEGRETAQVEYGGKTITMSCNLQYGILYFSDENGPCPLPFIDSFGPNNITVTAAKESDADGFKKVVGCGKVTVAGSRIFAYQNPDFPSEIYCADTENPLYFPENGSLSIGNTSQKITAVMPFGDDVLVFKEDGIYKITVTDGGRYRLNLPDSESSHPLSYPDKISCQALSSNTGCLYPETLCEVSGNLLWYGGGGTLCIMQSAAKPYIKITCPEKLKTLLDSDGFVPSVFATAQGGIYYLFCDGYIFVFDIRRPHSYTALSDPTQGAWYIWQLPDAVKIHAATDGAYGPIMCCTDRYSRVIFTARQGEEKDLLVQCTGISVSLVEYGIPSFFSTAQYRLPDRTKLKSIEEIFLSFEGDSIDLSIGKDKNFSVTLIGDGGHNTARIKPALRGVEGFSLSVSAESPFSVSGFSATYRNLPDVRWAAT